MKDIKIAVIGCGKVTEQFHLPALFKTSGVKIEYAVDIAEERALELSKIYEIPNISSEFHDIIGKVDAAVVTVPNHLHEHVCTTLLENNIHVLVEKPMALTVEDCEKMIATADENKKVLMVGLVRRYYSSSRYIKMLLDNTMLGTVRSFDFKEGMIYNWGAVSNFMFNKDTGGGVTYDIGVHVLDLLAWWLGDVKYIEYYDDAEGGVDANSFFKVELMSGAVGTLEFSRTRMLRNTFRITGDAGILETQNSPQANVSIGFNDSNYVLSGTIKNGIPAQTSGLLDCFKNQYNDFIESIKLNSKNPIDGNEGRKSVEMIEQALSVRQPLSLPWETFYEQ